MDRVTSNDGTPIAIERAGDGPVIVLVGGGLDDGSELRPLMLDLAGRGMTAVNYQRRGRGESGDTEPYGVAREIEDLAAVIAASGGQAHLFGASSGGALALEATAAGLPVDRLAVYEVPYVMAEEMLTRWREYAARLHEALAAGDRGLALEHFMRVAGSSDEDIAGVKVSPYWPGMETLAPTLAYDAACLGDGRPPADRLVRIQAPTLVLTNGLVDPQMAGLQPGFFDDAAEALAAVLPNATRATVAGDSHMVDAAIVGPIVARFLGTPDAISAT